MLLKDLLKRFSEIKKTATTTKKDIEEFGEVYTPENIVDDMVEVTKPTKSSKIVDLCAGFGQFSIGVLEYLFLPDENVEDFVKNNLIFVELQEKNCERLKYIFGKEIILFHGKSQDFKTSEKIDIVLGNPPYQIMDGGGGQGTSAKPIYNEIVTYTIDKLQPQYICMITPSRWMAGGKGLDDYRERMLKDKRIRLIQDFPSPSEVFKENNISGGVNYFLWDKYYNGLCEFNGTFRDINEFDVLIRDNNSISILKKVLSKHKGPFCNQKVLSQKPFGLRSDFKDWVSEETIDSIKTYIKLNGDFKYTFIKNIVDPNQIINNWKVFTGKANGAGQIPDSNGARKILAGSFIGKPNEICIETLLVTGTFNSKKEAENYSAYMKTKFYRFLLSLKLISQNISKDKFSFVPDFEDYTNAFTDKDLYEHFELTRNEIKHIESIIRELI